MRVHHWLLAIASLGFAYCGIVNAGPISTCGLDANQNIVCELYETDLQGIPTEIGPLILLPQPVGLGVVLILEPGGNINDRATWSDELIFTRDGNAFFVQMISNGCGTGNENDVSCFLQTTQDPIFEDANGFVSYDPVNHYHVHSDGEVPAPATLLLLGIGLAGLGWVQRKAA